jgi:ABC-type amino acid transport substrate-binding protein
MGITINVIYLPAARAEKELNKTNIDGELYRIVEFSASHPELIMIEEPVDNFNAVALSFENVTLDENNPKLELYKVGIRRGIIFSERLTAHFQPITVDSNVQLIDMLYMNRIDIAIMSKQNAQHLMQQKNEYKKIKITPIATYNLYHFLKKKHKYLADGVSKNLKELY